MVRFLGGWSRLRMDLPRHHSKCVASVPRLVNLSQNFLWDFCCFRFRRLLCMCRKFVVRRWWTQWSLLWTVIRLSTSGKGFKVYLWVWISFAHRCGGSNGNFDALYDCAKHILRYGTLSSPFVTLFWKMWWWSWLMTQYLRHLQRQLQLFFWGIIVRETCCLTIQCSQSALGDDLVGDYLPCAGGSSTRVAARLSLLLLAIWCTIWQDMPSSATVQYCGYSNMVGILCKVDCSSLSAKILLRTYSS